MRRTHVTNPLHRIQKWTGHYFRTAELWEVGSYILVPHRAGVKYCEALKFKMQELERVEQSKDVAEQNKLFASAPTYGETRMEDVEDLAVTIGTFFKDLSIHIH